MRLGVLFIVFTAIFSGCVSRGAESERFVLPAEWEPHDAVWVSFLGGPMDGAIFEIVKSIAEDTRVKCVIPAQDITGNTNYRLALAVQAQIEVMGGNLDNIEIIRADSAVQTRDTGPIFVRNERGDLRIVDFRWNNYGKPWPDSEHLHDTYPFDSLMAGREQIPLIRSSLVMEGGALETNGRGTLLQVESVTLQRNPGLSKSEIENELKRVLGQKKIIWLKEGLAEDPMGLTLITGKYLGSGVGGHIDEFSRFIDANTILLAFPDSAEIAADPVKKITYERMKINYDILRSETDQDGQPFQIIKVPVPDIPYETIVVDTTWNHPALQSLFDENLSIGHGDTLFWVPVSSYLNYFVTNTQVILPQYWSAGMPESVKKEDDEFRKIIERYLPGRKIVPINPIDLNNNGGGIHCWTLQQPARNR